MNDTKLPRLLKIIEISDVFLLTEITWLNCYFFQLQPSKAIRRGQADAEHKRALFELQWYSVQLSVFWQGAEREAEALTRKVFRHIHEKGLLKSGGCSVKSLLLRTAHHTANEVVWKRRFKRALMQKTVLSPRNVVEQDGRSFLLAILAKLPSEDQELFLLCRMLSCTTKKRLL